MKAAYLTLAMIGCAVSVHGTSHAFSFIPASPEQSIESSSRSLSGHATDVSSAHEGERQKDRTSSDKQRTRRRAPNENHQAKPIKANRPKQLRNGRERSPSKNVMSVAQPSSSKPGLGAVKVANNRTLPARTNGVAALSGQQFRNSRHRGTAPATVGGPPSSTRNTATISGTSMNRKGSH